METKTFERRGFLLALAGAGVALTTFGTGSVQAAAPLTAGPGPAPATGLDDIREALTPEGPEEMQRRRRYRGRRYRGRRRYMPPRRPRVRCWRDRFGRRFCRRVW